MTIFLHNVFELRFRHKLDLDINCKSRIAFSDNIIIQIVKLFVEN